MPLVDFNKELTTVFSRRRVLVTGHTGFKGSWLCHWLIKLGAEVTGFSLPGSVSLPSLFEESELASLVTDVRGDIRNQHELNRVVQETAPDFIFHLAAQPLVRKSYLEPVETWQTNVLGTIHLLEALRTLPAEKPVTAIMATTDKCYENKEWNYGYREEDPLGGHDPYSSSKAAAELAIASWRKSFLNTSHIRVASVRAGNVIGGGDWAENRILPDCFRALKSGVPIPVRNKVSTRPWQHVLEPLSGYLLLAARIAQTEDANPLCSAFNFGPELSSNRTVVEVVEEVLKHWPGTWEDRSDPEAPHEAGKLHLATDKAWHLLGWRPRWDFPTTIQKTVEWYREAESSFSPGDCKTLTSRQILEYSNL